MQKLFFNLSSKELKGKCGIYQLEMRNHLYIGSSKSLYSRLNEHRGDMLHGTHSNSFINKYFSKYGAEEVYYKVLEYCNLEERIPKEKYWIDTLKPDMNQQDPLTKELSKESRIKISESLKLAYKNGRAKPKFQPVQMYDIHGNFLREYKDVIIAAQETGLSHHTIQIAASRYYEGKVCGLYRFRYKYSKIKPRKFDYVKPQVITTRFDFFIVEPDGTEIKIKGGIKHFNHAILGQLLKGNTEFKIKGKPKVPFKSGELLETPNLGNQQPSQIGIFGRFND